MKKLIKDTPWSVWVAIVFLLAVYVLMCSLAPMVGLILSLSIGSILSFLRIMHYLNHGN
jgi:hypothetical protein